MALTAPYQAFIKTPNKEVVVLAEVVPKQHLIGWNSVLGLTRTTANPFDNFAVTDTIQGGIYKKLISVVQGTATLAVALQPGFVENTEGTWYYNEFKRTTSNELWPSEDLTDARWTHPGLTITPNDTVGPDGVTLADKLTEVVVSGHHRIDTSVSDPINQSIGDTGVVQAFVKADSRTICIVGNLGDTSDHRVFADLTTGTLLTKTGVDNSSIEDFGNGWYKVSMSYTAVSAHAPRPYVGLTFQDGTDEYVGNGGTIFATGVQFINNQSEVDFPYVQTFGSVVTLNPFEIWMYPKLSGGDITFTTVTNICLWSEDYLQAIWDGVADATAVQGISDPRGGVTGWTLSDTSGTQTESKKQDLVPTNNFIYTYSAFIGKTSGAVTFPGVTIRLSGGTAKEIQQTIDTNNGIIYTRPGRDEPFSRSIASWDNNWWRVSLAIQNNSSGNTQLRIEQLPAVNTDPTLTWSGAFQGSIGWWGSQMEESSTVGDYVKTQGTAQSKETVDFTGSTSAAVVAKFRVHFSTTAKIFDNIYYEPRLTTNSLPSIQEQVEDIILGVLKQVSSGDVSINNADGLFDTLTTDWTWKNSEIQLYLGGDSLTHIPGGGGDYAEVGAFFVEDYSFDLDEVSLFVRDVQKFSLSNLPITFVDSNTYPNAGSSEGGDRIPILFGQKSNITPILIDTTVEKGKYLIADPTYQTLFSIDAVFSDGSQVGVGDLTIDLTGCSFTIKNTFSGTPGAVTCNAIGQPVRGTAWETSVDYLKFYAEIVGEIYTNYLNVRPEKYDGVAARLVDAEEPSVQGAYISETSSVRTYIRKFEIGVLGRTVKTTAGVLTPTIWSTSQPVGTLEITDPDVVDFHVDPKIESLFTSLVILGDKDPSVGDFGVVVKSVTNTTAKYVQLNGLDVTKDVETFLKNIVDATSLATKVQRLTANPSIDVTIKETGISMMHLSIGDKLLVTFRRAPSSTGAWVQQLVEVVAINRSLSPQPAVEVVINNLRGVVFGNWTIDAAPVFTAASFSERFSLGFWSDDLGFADPFDITSVDISLWQ